MRDIYIKPSKYLNFPPGHMLKLLCPFYGLSDSGDYWHATFADHLKEDLKMKSTLNDISFSLNEQKDSWKAYWQAI